MRKRAKCLKFRTEGRSQKVGSREWWKRTGERVDGAGRGGLELAAVAVAVVLFRM